MGQNATQYPRSPGQRGVIRLQASPLASIQVVSSGTVAKPVPYYVGKNRKPINITPQAVPAPGGVGTI